MEPFFSRRAFACVAWAAAAVPLLGLTHCGGSDGTSPGGGTNEPQCRADEECASGKCENGTCFVAAGGTDAGPGVSPGPACTKNEDCPTGGCGDDGKCASAPSCVRAHGGRTCGPNGNDDCCAVATQGQYTIDRYLITAGRMRAFIERFQGDLKTFVGTLPAEKWKPAWSEADSLPVDIDSANEILGAYANKKSCDIGPFTGHTYWTPKAGDDYSDFDQDTLDEKALNCVPWPMMQALCAWDGGHLATLAELKAAFTNNGTTKYPWGDEALSTVSAPDPKERLNIEGSFKTTPLPTTFRKDADGNPQEAAFKISPPGRYPNGNNQSGVADSAGDLLEYVGDSLRQFVWKADFEHHASNAASLNAGNWWWEREPVTNKLWVWGTSQLLGNAGHPNERNGYYSIGGRCAH